MSWLLVALVPALLMLVAVELGRLENWLATERPTSRRDTLNGLQRRLASLDGDRLPTRMYSQPATNPEFHGTRHANRV